MAGALALDASPAVVLRALRGEVVDARIAYPEVLHVEIRDSGGGLWRLATQDAEWLPSDPAQLIGRSVLGAEIDEASARLRCELSDGTRFDVVPFETEARNDVSTWELISPTGLVLEFGPGLRWQISSADSAPSR